MVSPVGATRVAAALLVLPTPRVPQEAVREPGHFAEANGTRIYYEDRGEGRSDFVHEDVARDLLGLIDQLDITRAKPVGASAGAVALLPAATVKPDGFEAVASSERSSVKESESMAEMASGIGQIAPPLELPTKAGDLVSLASRRGQAVLVSFLSHAA